MGIPKGPETRSNNDNIVQKASSTQDRVWGLAQQEQRPGFTAGQARVTQGPVDPGQAALLSNLPCPLTKLKAGDGEKKKKQKKLGNLIPRGTGRSVTL